ncbi:MAG: hypothetical protein LBH67_03335, partial [Rickettsia sp.]|nr:hypothetical protein [Rickettsia sp.]
KLQSFKNIRVDDFFCNFLDKRFCFFFLKLEQIFIFQRSHTSSQLLCRTTVFLANRPINANRVSYKNGFLYF